ncbi:MAG: hypothetical protein AB3N33_07870 [Puniceicoccaceae bacterium]
MSNPPPSLLRVHLSVTVMVLALNVGILSCILAGYTNSQGIAGAPVRLLAFAAGNFLLAGYLALRFKGARLQLKGEDLFPLHVAAMVLSLAVPFSVFLLARSPEALTQLGPLVFAQSLFMTSAIGIQMNTIRHRF